MSASIRRETPSLPIEKDSDYLENQFVKSEYDMTKISNENKLINTENNQNCFNGEFELIKSIQNKNSGIVSRQNYRFSYVIVDRIEKGSIFVILSYFFVG